MERQELKGKTAIVTGASQGIGYASAVALAKAGATVVITGRGEAALEKARSEIAATIPGSRIEKFAADGTKEEDTKAAFAYAHRLAGRLDVIVSTVGGPTFKPILLTELAEVQAAFAWNFDSTFLAVRHGVPLLQRGGAIICLSTACALQAAWGLSIYASTKVAVERFVQAAAFEFGPAGIRINAVRPGLTLTPERNTPEHAPMAQAFIAETPMGRVGTPDEVASVVRFLAGPDSGWVTGQTFSADGGMAQGKAPDFMDVFYGKELMDQVRAGKPPG